MQCLRAYFLFLFAYHFISSSSCTDVARADPIFKTLFSACTVECIKNGFGNSVVNDAFAAPEIIEKSYERSVCSRAQWYLYANIHR